MALPADPTDPTASPPGFAGARISIEQAERLAAAFRPSWEIDEAPFIAAGAGSGGDPMVRHSPGTADVRGAVQALNGTHAPAPATVLMQQEPSSSVIVDGLIPVDAPAPTPAQARHDRPAQGPATAAPAPVVMPQQRTLVMTNSPVPAAIAAERRRARTLGLSKVDFRPSRTGLWIAAGAGAGALVGIVVWLASSPGEKPASSFPPAETTHATAARSPVPLPPPPVVTAVTASASPPPLTAATTPPPPSAPTQAVATVQERRGAAPVAQPAAPPRWVPTQAPRPTWTPTAPPPKALPRPKQGQTIVRDVPF